jgi:Taurine catabolism dioxygenase TauD, TfdA family
LQEVTMLISTSVDTSGALTTNEAQLPPPQEGPSVWYGPEMLACKAEWNVKLTADEVNELVATARAWLSTRDHINTQDLAILFSAEFPLPLLAAKIKQAVRDLQHGRGFTVFSGMPVHELSEREAAAAFSGLAAHMGMLRPQDARGSLVGHVRDQGLSSSDPNVRIYQTSERQGFHCDWADVVGLLCIRPAMRGGTSMLVSATAIFNEMRSRRPDLLAALMQPVATDRRGEVSLGEKPYDMIPVFSYCGGARSALHSALLSYQCDWSGNGTLRCSQCFACTIPAPLDGLLS